VTLTFAAFPELASEGRRLVEALHGHGVAATHQPWGAKANASSVLHRLRDEEVDAALVRAEGMLDIPDDLRLAAVLPREEPRDILIPAREGAATLHALASGSRVGVGGGRRRGFLKAYRQDVQAVAPGNGGGPAVALQSGAVDAVILGMAEARRLSLASRATEIMDPKAWVPGAGQGTVLLLARGDDTRVHRLCADVDHPTTRAAYRAESTTIAAQGAAPDAPIGVMALPHGRWIRVWGMAASEDGSRVVRGDVTGTSDDPEGAGRALAELMVARGVATILRGVPA
jgi:hydroxymethylbilane synthase